MYLVNAHYVPGTVLGTVGRCQHHLSLQGTDSLVCDREERKQTLISLTRKYKSSLGAMCCVMVSSTCSGGRVPGFGSESAASPNLLGGHVLSGPQILHRNVVRTKGVHICRA